MDGRRDDHDVEAVDIAWHGSRKLNEAVKQFHDRCAIYVCVVQYCVYWCTMISVCNYSDGVYASGRERGVKSPLTCRGIEGRMSPSSDD